MNNNNILHREYYVFPAAAHFRPFDRKGRKLTLQIY